MKPRRGVITGLAAMALLMARAAHADESLLAQAGWPPPLQQPMTQPPVLGPRVMLQTDNPHARLQQHTPLLWRDICIAPCGVAVDPTGLYRIGGGESIASETFQLPRSSGDVYIDAQVGSRVKHFAGLGMMIGGGVAALYGLLYWQFSNAFRDTEAQTGSGSTGFSDTVRNIGLILIGAGAVVEIIGIVMFAGGTSVQVR